MSQINVLVIPVEGPAQNVTIEGNLEQLQQLVGGDIEMFGLLADGTDAVINADGKMMSLPANELATRLLRHAGGQPTDWIAGPMLLVGSDDSGNVASLSDMGKALLAEMSV